VSREPGAEGAGSREPGGQRAHDQPGPVPLPLPCGLRIPSTPSPVFRLLPVVGLVRRRRGCDDVVRRAGGRRPEAERPARRRREAKGKSPLTTNN
jgi:hypothetical protein